MESSAHEQHDQTIPVAWQHNKNLGDCMIELYDKKLWTDVKFRCKDHDENERIHAHKIVLAARSPVFQAMFFGLCADGKDNVQLDNTEANILDLLLRYIYNDTVILNDGNASAVLEIAHYYQVTNLVQFCADYLATFLTPENACGILTLAMFYKVSTLRDACCTIIDRNADEILRSEGFLELSEECLTYILKGDTFYTDEDNIFIKAEEWSKRRIGKKLGLEKTGPDIRKTLGASFYYIRLPTMTFDSLTKCTSKKGYFSVEEYEDIVEFINTIPASSVKSNSCMARLPWEETMALNEEDGETTVNDNITTKFQISVLRELKLTNFVVTQIRKYLKYKSLVFTDENCHGISLHGLKIDDLVQKFENKPLKLRSQKAPHRQLFCFKVNQAEILKAADGEELSDTLDTLISGTFKVTDGRYTSIRSGESERVIKLHEDEDTENRNGGSLKKRNADGVEEDSLTFEQKFQVHSSDVTSMRIDLRESLTLTQEASPYTVEITMHYGCTSGVKMKTICSKTKTARSRFGQLQVEDIAGQFAGIKSIGFENISNRKCGKEMNVKEEF